MDPRELEDLLTDVATVTRQLVEKAVAPIASRLDALERGLAELPVPKDGRDADEEAVAAIVAEKIAGELADLRSAVEAIPEAPELPDVAGMIAEAMATIPAPVEPDAIKVMIDDAVGAIPAPRDGRDADPEEIRAMVAEAVETAVSGLPAPRDGKSVTIDDVRPLIDEAVAMAVAEIPAPRDGNDGAPGRDGLDGKDGAAGKDGRDGVDGKDGAPGRDGAGVAGAVIDRAGNLVLTLTDGTTRELGLVVGKDGAPGRDGADGVGFDDMIGELREDGAYLVWQRGDVEKEWRLPVPIYRGVWKEGAAYRVGDFVTWGGSLWHCDVDETTEKPDGAAKHWTLAAKRGRDGKDKS